MVDTWMAERDDDARSLAEAAGIPASDSAAISPAMAARLLRVQMEALRRRGNYTAIWIVDTDRPSRRIRRRPPAQRRREPTRPRAPSRREPSRSAFPPRATARSPSASRIRSSRRRHHGTARRSGRGLPRRPQSRLRAGRRPRCVPAFAPVIVVPANGRALGISLCPAPAIDDLPRPRWSTRSRGSRCRADTFSSITPRGASRLLVATHRIASIPWTVYYAGDERAQFAPMRERLRFESLRVHRHHARRRTRPLRLRSRRSSPPRHRARADRGAVRRHRQHGDGRDHHRQRRSTRSPRSTARRRRCSATAPPTPLGRSVLELMPGRPRPTSSADVRARAAHVARARRVLRSERTRRRPPPRRLDVPDGRQRLAHAGRRPPASHDRRRATSPNGSAPRRRRNGSAACSRRSRPASSCATCSPRSRAFRRRSVPASSAPST